MYSVFCYSAHCRIIGFQQNILFRQIATIWVSVVLYSVRTFLHIPAGHVVPGWVDLVVDYDGVADPLFGQTHPFKKMEGLMHSWS